MRNQRLAENVDILRDVYCKTMTMITLLAAQECLQKADTDITDGILGICEGFAADLDAVIGDLETITLSDPDVEQLQRANDATKASLSWSN